MAHLAVGRSPPCCRKNQSVSYARRRCGRSHARRGFDSLRLHVVEYETAASARAPLFCCARSTFEHGRDSAAMHKMPCRTAAESVGVTSDHSSERLRCSQHAAGRAPTRSRTRVPRVCCADGSRAASLRSTASSNRSSTMANTCPCNAEDTPGRTGGTHRRRRLASRRIERLGVCATCGDGNLSRPSEQVPTKPVSLINETTPQCPSRAGVPVAPPPTRSRSSPCVNAPGGGEVVQRPPRAKRWLGAVDCPRMSLHLDGARGAGPPRRWPLRRR